LIRLDFGTSLVDGRSVRETIMTYLPNTLLLAAAAMTFAVPLALLLGFKSVCGRGQLWKATATLFSAIGLATPVFLAGICLILLFAVGLGFFPVSGGGGIDFLVLPALTLALPLGAQLIRMVRTSLLAESERPYVLLARAKGLSQTQIYRRHILRNALPPVITLIGLQTGAVLGGAVIVENVFSWPGIGTLMLTAVRQRDYPMIQGTVMLVALLYLFVNHLVDTVYPLLDPRLDNDSIR
jgi:peptide/nickel transport system permease protein